MLQTLHCKYYIDNYLKNLCNTIHKLMYLKYTKKVCATLKINACNTDFYLIFFFLDTIKKSIELLIQFKLITRNENFIFKEILPQKLCVDLFLFHVLVLSIALANDLFVWQTHLVQPRVLLLVLPRMYVLLLIVCPLLRSKRLY